MDTRTQLATALSALSTFTADVPATPSEAMFLESRLRNLACVLRTARKETDAITEQMLEVQR